MKQVKKLLVILPLVALFVLGSLPVLAAEDPAVVGATKTLEKAKALIEGVVPSKDGSELKEGVKWVPQEKLTAIGKAIKSLEDTLNPSSGSITAATVTTKDAALKNVIDSWEKEKLPNVVEAAKTEEVQKQLVIEYYADPNESAPHPKEKTRTYTIPAELFKKGSNGTLTDSYEDITTLAQRLVEFVYNQQQNSYQYVETSVNAAAQALLKGAPSATIKLCEPWPAENRRKRVIAYNIHRNRMAFDQISEVELNRDYESTVDIVEAFYNNSAIRNDYILVGYIRRGERPVLTAPIAAIEKINETYLNDTMNATYVNAEYAALVVPNFIRVPVDHIFPEGTRDTLREIVNVPYSTWVTLQNTWKLVDIPSIFRTRIQKINEEGYAFKSMEYYNGVTKITGLVASYDWANYFVTSDGDDQFVARVYYDRAVAAAKEVPSEKKVDAATAPQAQIQAPAAQAPVTAANITTTTAPANTLPVTGASDSIFLFLSSAALMAVGILFFKKH